MSDLLERTVHRCWEADHLASIGQAVDVAAAVWQRRQGLATAECLAALGEQMVAHNAAIFYPIPHADTLPAEVLCHIRLKDAQRQISTCTYASLRKYKEAWATLIICKLAR